MGASAPASEKGNKPTEIERIIILKYDYLQLIQDDLIQASPLMSLTKVRNYYIRGDKTS
jgi:hypothetical protein